MKKSGFILCLMVLGCIGYGQKKQDTLIQKDTVYGILEQGELLPRTIDAGIAPLEFDNQEAKIVVEPFVNKAGREYPDLAEYYLEFNEEQYFIKFSESGITPATLKPLVGQSVYFDGELREGMWDSDDPNVQSRIGNYLAVKRVRK